MGYFPPKRIAKNALNVVFNGWGIIAIPTKIYYYKYIHHFWLTKSWSAKLTLMTKISSLSVLSRKKNGAWVNSHKRWYPHRPFRVLYLSEKLYSVSSSDSLDLSVVYTTTSTLLSTAEIDSGERFDTLFKTEELLAALPQEAAEAIILVGGIALLLWGQQYLLSLVSGEEYAALASDDLDFMGHKNAVILCAKTWGGEIRFPSMDEHTPQSAIISIPVKKDIFLIVDFLDKVFGVPLHNIHKYCDKLTFGENEIYTLSPYLCLKSRICNLHGLHYDAVKTQRELIRIKLAASICRQYIIEHLESGDPIRIKSAIGVAKYIGRNIFSTKEAIAVAERSWFN